MQSIWRRRYLSKTLEKVEIPLSRTLDKNIGVTRNQGVVKIEENEEEWWLGMMLE
jgi:hypothetical protein